MSPTTTTTSASGMPQFVNRQQNHMPCIAGHHIKSNPHKVESFPRGYPSLAAFLSSDKEFTVFRCFSRLHTRVLLHKQDELAQLEQRLDELDEEDSRNNSYRLLTNRHRGGDQDRQVLLGEIERKLNEYNTLFQSLRVHLEGPELEESQIENIRNWMDGRKPIVYAETSFLDDWGDLRRPNYSTDRGGLEDLIDRCSSLPHMQGIYKVFSLLFNQRYNR
ncbi:hypothetical protein FAVG1_10228 [Fusarium avenaceum]|nr:hypothetical protein FAVG1_10228 [Fusarium avenaceum]